MISFFFKKNSKWFFPCFDGIFPKLIETLVNPGFLSFYNGSILLSICFETQGGPSQRSYRTRVNLLSRAKFLNNCFPDTVLLV